MAVRVCQVGTGLSSTISKIQEDINMAVERDKYMEGPGIRFKKVVQTLRGGSLFFTTLYNTPAAQKNDPDHVQFEFSGSITRGGRITLTGVYSAKETNLAMEQIYRMAQPYIRNLKRMRTIEVNESLSQHSVVARIKVQNERNDPTRDPAGPLGSNSAVRRSIVAMNAVTDTFYEPVPISRATLLDVFTGAVCPPHGLLTPIPKVRG
jgi:hypothetical protein